MKATQTNLKIFIKRPLRHRSSWMMSSTIDLHTTFSWRILGRSEFLRRKGETTFNRSLNAYGYKAKEEELLNHYQPGRMRHPLPNLLIPRILQLTHHDHPLLKDLLPKNFLHSENVDNNFSIIRTLLTEVRTTYLKTLRGHFFEQKSIKLVNCSDLSPRLTLWRTSSNFSMSHPLPLQLFRLQFYQQHLTSLLSQSTPFSTLTFKQLGSFANHSILTKPSIRSSISCNFSLSLT